MAPTIFLFDGSYDPGERCSGSRCCCCCCCCRHDHCRSRPSHGQWAAWCWGEGCTACSLQRQRPWVPYTWGSCCLLPNVQGTQGRRQQLPHVHAFEQDTLRSPRPRRTQLNHIIKTVRLQQCRIASCLALNEMALTIIGGVVELRMDSTISHSYQHMAEKRCGTAD